MLIIKIFVLTVLAVYLSHWAYQHIIVPGIEKRRLLQWMNSTQIKPAFETFNALYAGVNGAAVAERAKKKLKSDDNSLVYGEINFLSFAQALEIAAPQADDVFYDLGSGMGMPCFAAALLYEIKSARGVELLEGLYQQSSKLVEKLADLTERKCNIEFINDSFFNVYISDADIVFINATAYFGEIWDDLSDKLNGLNTGARVIISSKKLNLGYFELLDERFRLMSWGMCTVRVYRKIHVN